MNSGSIYKVLFNVNNEMINSNIPISYFLIKSFLINIYENIIFINHFTLTGNCFTMYRVTSKQGRGDRGVILWPSLIIRRCVDKQRNAAMKK